ncbi:MAG TPA: PEP/pyruvate-binding domain-containing protein [Anaerolineales bacterium]|nr:PEP/pyruvate-binding domain-containing protein [Anaerolineales bacterium]
MTFPSPRTDPILRVSLALAEYPILADRIREEMRAELDKMGVISPNELEEIVREQAILSQKREGLADPYGEEPATVWDTRVHRVREHLTDFYFATNLPYELFEQIVINSLANRGHEQEVALSFSPELSPKYMLFDQARAILQMPPEEQEKNQAILEEIKVVLIRAMISDQLEYVRIAKDWFSIDALEAILKHKIGYGKIGGKAAGMLLAEAILKEKGDEDVRESLHVPISYFLGADLMYTFMTRNGLMQWNRQKYKSEEEIRAEYPVIWEQYLAGEFPRDILERLGEMLERLSPHPVIVRSSSQLEDNFGTSFAGKYESFFCPNQGTPEENLQFLTRAIASVYASTLNPDALIYRRSKGLQDYDERMAILIQAVEGERFERYLLPHAAGVAFSRNLYRWSTRINRDDGFLRLVWGLGTRAVDTVANDYPRLVALSHPTLRPETSSQAIMRYSQQSVDVIDLEANEFKTLPVSEVLNARYPILRYVAQVYKDGFLSPIRSNLLDSGTDRLVITFDDLLRRTPFPDRMRRLLKTLEKHYQSPVDMEFAIRITDARTTHPDVRISILQCRPQSQIRDSHVQLPAGLDQADIVFSTKRMVPRGHVTGIRYVVYVPAEGYFSLPTEADRLQVGRAIGKLNKALQDQVYICIGPGRWGTSNLELGVKVGYSDIFNARALIELTGADIGPAPEPSFGTHFFQDLMESNTYPLAIFLEDPDVIFDRKFFYDSENVVESYLPEELGERAGALRTSLHLIDVETVRPGCRLELIMDDDRGKAVCFFAAIESEGENGRMGE